MPKSSRYSFLRELFSLVLGITGLILGLLILGLKTGIIHSTILRLTDAQFLEIAIFGLIIASIMLLINTVGELTLFWSGNN